jgi:hypothetical protein
VDAAAADRVSAGNRQADGAAPSAHRRLVAAMLIAAAVLTFAAIFSIWVNRQALNTDNWVNTSGKLLENEQIDAQLSTFLVTQLYANVDVQAELEKALPPQARALAGPAAGGLRQLAERVALRALASPPVQAVWAEANRAAHEQLLKVVDGGGSVVSTEGGEVTLQLAPLLSQIGSQVGLPGNLTEKLPSDAGELTVMNSQQLSTAQKVARAVRRLPIVLTALLVLLYGGAILLARGRRRQAVRGAGIGFVVAGVLALLVRRIAGHSIVDALSSTASVKPAAEAAWNIGTSLLVTVAASAVAFGLLLLIGAWLAGETSPARALRREAAPYLRDHRAAAYGVAAAIWLALIAWALIAAFDKPLGIAVFAVLFAIGTEALRRQALAEFPGAQATPFGDRLRRFQRRDGGDGLAVPVGDPVLTRQRAQLDDLERLAELRRSGALSETEFEAQKRELLGTG